MIKFLLILLLPLSIYASKILSYNIYDRTDRVDVMITFDTPYEGVIKQSKSSSKIIIKLEDSKIESSKIKKLSTKFLQSITITPMAGYTQIVASVPSSVHLIASKTSDSYGLRLRFTNKAATTANSSTPASSNSLNHLPTKSDEGMSQSYYIVVGILIIGIIILFLLKNKIASPANKKNSSAGGWSFNETNSQAEDTPVPSPKALSNDENVSIRFQKKIDDTNSVIMLDFDDQSYLLLMGKGNGNILLDKFTDDKPTTQDDFESILQSRHQELDEFLRVEKREEPKEALQSYKEKAASLIYSQDD